MFLHFTVLRVLVPTVQIYKSHMTNFTIFCYVDINLSRKYDKWLIVVLTPKMINIYFHHLTPNSFSVIFSINLH